MKPFINLGFIQIPTFYLIISFSLCLSILWFGYSKHPENKNKENTQTFGYDLLLIILISGFFGARLFHIIYEEPEYYSLFPLETIKFWNGGFVYYGGFLASLAASYIFIRLKKESFLVWADFLTPFLSLTYMLGRLGCFFEGCCYGKSCALPWAIHNQHPTQLYMFFSELLILSFIIYIEKKKFKKTLADGFIFMTWLVLSSSARFVIEFYRADDRGTFIAGLSISQIISALVVIACGLKLYLLSIERVIEPVHPESKKTPGNL